MKKFDLQLFANKAIQGSKILYLFRILSKAATSNAMAMAFVTENERSKSKDVETTQTKDGAVLTPGAIEGEVSATAILSTDDTMAEELEDALDNNEVLEIWEVNLEKPGTTDGKYKGRYFQGYLTEFTLTSSSEEAAEYETTFALIGSGAKGDVTVSDEQMAVAEYVFADTQKTGA